MGTKRRSIFTLAQDTVGTEVKAVEKENPINREHIIFSVPKKKPGGSLIETMLVRNMQNIFAASSEY
jgi:hypothetical protein